MADMMGMGKTIQAVALILSNPPPNPPEPSPLPPAKTLVVVPTIALLQWQQEIKNYTSPNALRVVIYHNNRSPALLAEADVVLTTYKVIESEYRKSTSNFKVTCNICSKRFYPEKFRLHRKYFCGENAHRTAKQSLTQRKKDKFESSEESTDDDSVSCGRQVKSAKATPKTQSKKSKKTKYSSSNSDVPLKTPKKPTTPKRPPLRVSDDERSDDDLLRRKNTPLSRKKASMAESESKKSRAASAVKKLSPKRTHSFTKTTPSSRSSSGGRSISDDSGSESDVITHTPVVSTEQLKKSSSEHPVKSTSKKMKKQLDLSTASSLPSPTVSPSVTDSTSTPNLKPRRASFKTTPYSARTKTSASGKPPPKKKISWDSDSSSGSDENYAPSDGEESESSTAASSASSDDIFIRRSNSGTKKTPPCKKKTPSKMKTVKNTPSITKRPPLFIDDSNEEQEEDSVDDKDNSDDSEVERIIKAASKHSTAATESPLHNYFWHRVILDEAHVIKDRSTSTAKAVFYIESNYKWCLTGFCYVLIACDC